MAWTNDDLQILQTALNPLINKMESFQRQLNTFQQTQNSFQKCLDNLTVRVDTLTDRVDTLADRVDTLTDRVDTLTDRVDTLTIRMDNVEGKLEAVHQSQINMENVLPLKVAAALDGFSLNRDKLDEHGGRIDFLERKADIHDLRLFALEQTTQEA